jgi:hypothetical protein
MIKHANQYTTVHGKCGTEGCECVAGVSSEMRYNEMLFRVALEHSIVRYAIPCCA